MSRLRVASGTKYRLPPTETIPSCLTRRSTVSTALYRAASRALSADCSLAKCSLTIRRVPACKRTLATVPSHSRNCRFRSSALRYHGQGRSSVGYRGRAVRSCPWFSPDKAWIHAVTRSYMAQQGYQRSIVDHDALGTLNDNGGFHSVVKYLRRSIAHRVERVDMEAHDCLQFLRRTEPAPQQAAMEQHHPEQPEDPGNINERCGRLTWRDSERIIQRRICGVSRGAAEILIRFDVCWR